jgi:pimeloyl-ACP methyl ester carboxylesterase
MRRVLHSLLISAAFALPATAATVDGLKIHSAATGQGKQTVIFIHGWTCDSSSWQSQVPEFARKYRVVTVDLPGHGRSDSPADGKFTMDLFARAVEAVRNEVKADKVVLVGHSMGAPVIRQYARLYPQHVAALVAVDGPLVMTGFGGGARGGGPPPMTGPEGLKARENMIRGMFTPQTPQPLQEHILKMMLGTPESTANGAMAAVFDKSLSKTDVIKAPALSVYAGTATMPDVKVMKEVFPNSEVTQVAGTGHFVMMEKPEEFNRVLTSFLDKIKF